MTDEQRARRVWWEQSDSGSVAKYAGHTAVVFDISGGEFLTTITNEAENIVFQETVEKSQRQAEILLEKRLKHITKQSKFNRSPRMK